VKAAKDGQPEVSLNVARTFCGQEETSSTLTHMSFRNFRAQAAQQAKARTSQAGYFAGLAATN